MKRLVMWLGILVMVSSATAVSWSSMRSASTDDLSSWEGTWTGTMRAHGRTSSAPHEVNVTFTMTRLEDQPGYQWKMEYHAPDRPVTKDYRLVPGDDDPSQWLMDEQNGIVLPSRLVDGMMFSVFRIGESVYTSRQERIGDDLWFEVTMSEPSGDAVDDAAVRTYGTIAVQRVKLRRKPSES